MHDLPSVNFIVIQLIFLSLLYFMQHVNAIYIVYLLGYP